MAERRKPKATRYTGHVSRDVHNVTLGTHVQRSTPHVRRSVSNARQAAKQTARAASSQARIEPQVADGAITVGRRGRHGAGRGGLGAIQKKHRSRRLAVGAVAVVIVVAIAALAGFMAFRSVVGSQMALRDSDAPSALVSVKSDEPYYALIAVELGAVAQPLEHDGPDVLFLARVDRVNHTLALINIPAGLQVATDSGYRRIGSTATKGDAALITAVANLAKVDISHYVKVEKGGLEGIVDALGGIEVSIDQVIDDPHAGDVYLPTGTYTLNGASALTYLRAENLKQGVTDQLDHQVKFAALLFEKVFASEGVFATRLDAIDGYFQTDLALGDIEALQSWMRDLSASDITCVCMPGYLTEATGAADQAGTQFIGSSDDLVKIIESLEAGETPAAATGSTVEAADPGSFTVEVQNGTDIVGAAASTSDSLASAGFNVTKSGNAEQQVYTETLIVYKDAEGQGKGRAQAVINALGLGRAVAGDVYYSFDSDVLVIIGSDYTPLV